MRTFSLKFRGMLLHCLVVLLLAVAVTDANAVTLSGGWAPYTRCPVSDPALLATDGVNTVSFCTSVDSTGGTLQIGTMGVMTLGPIQIGNAPITAGKANVQFGGGPSIADFYAITPIPTVAGTGSGGAALVDPVEVPGGLLGLVCDGSNFQITMMICNLITNNALNRVTATLESAGAPRDFVQFNAALPSVQILTLPVKFHLSHPLLGNDCYIGSDQNPILLHLQNLAVGDTVNTTYNLDGTEVSDFSGLLFALKVSNSTIVDNSFTVPKASGCGFLPFLQPAVNSVLNLKVGLPAAAGRNHLKLTNVTSNLITPADPSRPVDGTAFANAWAAAITAP